jgi:hypothetical protein
MFGRGPTYSRKDCSFCKTLRIVIAMAVLVLALASLTFDFGLLEGIYFTDLFATIVGIGFFVVFGWKLWDEYLRKRFKNPKQ